MPWNVYNPVKIVPGMRVFWLRNHDHGGQNGPRIMSGVITKDVGRTGYWVEVRLDDRSLPRQWNPREVAEKARLVTVDRLMLWKEEEHAARAFVEFWEGKVRARQAKVDRAQSHLDEAREILRRLSMAPSP